MKQQYEMNKSEVLWRMSAQNFKSLLITTSHQSTGHMDLYESLNFAAGFFCRSQVIVLPIQKVSQTLAKANLRPN